MCGTPLCKGGVYANLQKGEGIRPCARVTPIYRGGRYVPELEMWGGGGGHTADRGGVVCLKQL